MAAMRVLLIDDERSCREAFRVMLERCGFEVVEAAGGAEGLAASRRHGADVVVCSLFMPGVDGLEVLRAQRGARPCNRTLSSGAGEGRLGIRVRIRRRRVAHVLPRDLAEALGRLGSDLAGVVEIRLTDDPLQVGLAEALVRVV
jgi:hypothetical protein